MLNIIPLNIIFNITTVTNVTANINTAHRLLIYSTKKLGKSFYSLIRPSNKYLLRAFDTSLSRRRLETINDYLLGAYLRNIEDIDTRLKFHPL